LWRASIFSQFAYFLFFSFLTHDYPPTHFHPFIYHKFWLKPLAQVPVAYS